MHRHDSGAARVSAASRRRAMPGTGRRPVAPAVGFVSALLFLAWRIHVDHIDLAPVAAVGATFTAALAGVAAIVAPSRPDARERWAWRLIAAGCGAWAIASLARPALGRWHGAGDGRELALHAGFLVLLPLVAVGVLLLAPSPAERTNGLQLTLDLVIAAASLLTITWFFVLGPILGMADAPAVAWQLAILHGLGNVALLLSMLAVGLRLGNRPVPPAFAALAAGIVAFVLGDTLWLVRRLDGSAAGGVVADGLRSAAFVSVALGGLLQRRAEPVSRGVGDLEIDREALWRVILPYPLALTLLIVAAWEALHDPMSRDGGSVIIGSLTVVGVVLARQALTVRDSRRLMSHLSQQVDRDPLTGLINHRKLHDRLDRELAHARACGHPVAVALIDVDNFKAINDTFGHQTGDDVLRSLARIFGAACRGTDVAARYGGDEFMLVLPGLALPDARAVGAHVMATVQASGGVLAPRANVAIRLSIGVAVTHRCHRSTRQLIAIADAAMYDAKHGGKNQIRVVDADSFVTEPASETNSLEGDLAAFSPI